MNRAILMTILLTCLLVTATRSQNVPKADNKHVSARIRLYLSRLEGFGFSGAALVAKDGKIMVERAYGYADRNKKIPMRTDTLFDIGSVTKQFTAAAILCLESDGKLLVTDPISKYLPNVPEDKAAITIHYLLTHTSGLSMDFGADYEKVSRDEIVRRAMTSRLQSTPGERHAYSNAGFSLLAAIVEIVSGQTIETFLRERLFKPAGMTSTGYFFTGDAVHRLARGYKDGEEWGIGMEKAASTGGDFWNLIGNGGVHSTVGDLYRWIAALQGGKVLTKEARQKFFEPHVLVTANYKKSNSPLYYAYGWYVWKQSNGKTLIFHLGGNSVFNAAIRFHVDDRAVVVYLANVSEFQDPDYPVPAIERMLAGEAVEMPPKLKVLSEKQMTEYMGRYLSESNAVLDLVSKGRFLEARGDGQPALSLIATGKWENDEMFSALSRRTAQVVENSRTGKYDAAWKEYAGTTTLEDLTELEKLFWKKRYDRHGAYKRTRVLGTLPSQRRAFIGRTIVAIDFERGTTYREYLWTSENKIGDVGPIVSDPSARYFPESPNCFVRFEPAEAMVSSRVCFERSKLNGIRATLRDRENQVKLTRILRR